jgi:hypothetical protein
MLMKTSFKLALPYDSPNVHVSPHQNGLGDKAVKEVGCDVIHQFPLDSLSDLTLLI